MTPDAMTAAWFTRVLGQPVLAVCAAPVGTGQVGTSIRCELTYAEDAAGGAPGHRPASVVVKVPSVDEVSRATGIATLTYEREAGFYRELQHTVAVRSPRCHHLDWDPVTHDFALVLEDLAPCEQGDQIVGCGPDRAELALVELAALHAPRWGDPHLGDVAWLGRATADQSARVQALYEHLWPGFAERYGAALDADQLELGAWFGPRLAVWSAARSGPWALTHGDYRPDNLLFRTGADAPPIAVVDWQTVGHGPATADLAYFLGGGVTVDDRRRSEHDLVGVYHRALVARDVTGWSRNDCWDAYRRTAFTGVVMTVVSSMIVGRTERGDAMFSAMAARHLQHALDLDARALVV